MSPGDDLRRALEEAYARLRTALARRDLGAFRDLAEPAPSSPGDWEETAAGLEDSFPPPEETRFLAVREAGDWAGYYFETELGDRKYATLELLRFRRTAGGWKLSGGPVASQVERPPDPAALLELVRDDPFLRLPGEPGYEEE